MSKLELEEKEKRAYLVEQLSNNIAWIEFTKKDGSNRKMKCTLRADLLPKREVKEDSTPKPINEEIISVFDLEKDAWRSFRVDSVTELICNLRN